MSRTVPPSALSLQPLVRLLADDLLARSTSDAKIDAGLKEAFQQIEKGGRTAQAFEVWREDYLDQVAVAWVLACVFVRFMEDNGLIDECWLAGEGERRRLAEDTHELFFRKNPHDTDREYFQHVFKEVGQIPAAKDLFAEGKTPLWAVAPSGDAAMKLLKFWREMDAETGTLLRSFGRRKDEGGRRNENSDSAFSLEPSAFLDTRFLGDLYQELSERAKKKFALLQTPVFVEEFILDRTLTPALAEFGLEKVRMIDPTCGSGHFLLGGFARLFDLWSQRESNEIKAAQKALDGVWGVDINPFAVAIARFRLIVAAVQACGIKRLKQAPGWNIHLASGDSLLFGSKPSFGGQRVGIAQQLSLFEVPAIYAVEDRKALQEILGQGYHVVVGNPPYITVKDSAQNDAYRSQYTTCYRQYSLGVPFTQRFWELAIQQGECNDECGHIGMITANSFMKREFGKKLIEEYLPKIDLTHIIDTSGMGPTLAGHGTPTVILFGRSRKPISETLRAVLGIKGEPSEPDDHSQGLVWQSIITQIDHAGAENEYTSTSDMPRSSFSTHPWSIGGGGATDVQESLNSNAVTVLGDMIHDLGFCALTRDDDVFLIGRGAVIRHGVESCNVRPYITGENVRDWSVTGVAGTIWPYHLESLEPQLSREAERLFWLFKRQLCDRVAYGLSQIERGLMWFEYSMFFKNRFRSRSQIAFAAVATHNHFVFLEGRNLFNRHAPIIIFPDETPTSEQIAVLGLLNSSTAGFWMKQVFQDKGSGGIGGGIGAEKWERRYEHDGTKLKQFPICEGKPLSLAALLRDLGSAGESVQPEAIVSLSTPSKESLADAKRKLAGIHGQMISLQEELDWQCYQLFGLLSDDLQYSGDDLPELTLGQRAFEIVMARQIAKGELETTWFERHGSTPITEIPSHWPAAYRTLVERRIKLIETNKEIALIEKPEYKRRWNTEPWEEQEQRALKNWLLDRLETTKYTKGTKENPELTTTAQMADVASADAEFLQVAALYRGRPDFDVAALVAELVEAEAVPLLPVLRYKPAGLRKREVWERVWELQRLKDEGERLSQKEGVQPSAFSPQPSALSPQPSALSLQPSAFSLQPSAFSLQPSEDIPVPPKYATADFLKTDYWRLRGKLDVPKERWVSYPHCSTDSDPTLVVGWAGWNHLEQATALIAYYDARKREGWDAKRLTPLLAGLDQLLPWIHQWHPEIDKESGQTAGQEFQSVLESDAHEIGLTLEVIRNWTPPEKAKKTPKGRKKKAEAEVDE